MTIEQQRLEQLEFYIPDIWNHNNYLYVGANEKSFHFKEQLEGAWINGAVIDVIEIDPDNIPHLMTFPFINRVINIDIQEFVMAGLYYGVIIWSHGPTCLESKDMAILTLISLKMMCDILVTMGPIGTYPPDEHRESSFDTNRIKLYPPFFRGLGMDVATIGPSDTAGSNLLAWSRQ